MNTVAHNILHAVYQHVVLICTLFLCFLSTGVSIGLLYFVWCCSQTNVVKSKIVNAHNSFAEKYKNVWLFFFLLSCPFGCSSWIYFTCHLPSVV